MQTWLVLSHFTAFPRCCIFLLMESKPSTIKKTATCFIAAVRSPTRNTFEVRLSTVDGPQRHSGQLWGVRGGFAEEVTTEL